MGGVAVLGRPAYGGLVRFGRFGFHLRTLASDCATGSEGGDYRRASNTHSYEYLRLDETNWELPRLRCECHENL